MYYPSFSHGGKRGMLGICRVPPPGYIQGTTTRVYTILPGTPSMPAVSPRLMRYRLSSVCRSVGLTLGETRGWEGLSNLKVLKV